MPDAYELLGMTKQLGVKKQSIIIFATMGQVFLRCKKSVVEDFKREIGKGLLTTICAFLNTQGGLIYVGYDDKGFPVGLADVQGAASELRLLIQSAFEPPVQKYISWDCFQSEGKSIILIKVTKSESDVLLNVKNDKRWYRRVGGSNKSFDLEKQRLWDAGVKPVNAVDSNLFKIGNYAAGSSYYHYMNLETAILCLRNSSIRFVEPSTWQDKFESRFYKAKIGGKRVSNLNPILFAYCVTNRRDNEAAWKIYSYGKVGLGARCVQFKINRKRFREALIETLAGKYSLYEGAVTYMDELKLCQIHMPKIGTEKPRKKNMLYETFFHGFDLNKYLNLLLLKRTAFLHEQETRFLLIPQEKGEHQEKGKSKFVDLTINWGDVVEEVSIDGSCSDFEIQLLEETIRNYLNLPDHEKAKLMPQRRNIYGDTKDGTLSIKIQQTTPNL